MPHSPMGCLTWSLVSRHLPTTGNRDTCPRRGAGWGAGTSQDPDLSVAPHLHNGPIRVSSPAQPCCGRQLIGFRHRDPCMAPQMGLLPPLGRQIGCGTGDQIGGVAVASLCKRKKTVWMGACKTPTTREGGGKAAMSLECPPYIPSSPRILYNRQAARPWVVGPHGEPFFCQSDSAETAATSESGPQTRPLTSITKHKSPLPRYICSADPSPSVRLLGLAQCPHVFDSHQPTLRRHFRLGYSRLTATRSDGVRRRLGRATAFREPRQSRLQFALVSLPKLATDCPGIKVSC
jgi:hypothetical protein